MANLNICEKIWGQNPASWGLTSSSAPVNILQSYSGRQQLLGSPALSSPHNLHIDTRGGRILFWVHTNTFPRQTKNGGGGVISSAEISIRASNEDPSEGS